MPAYKTDPETGLAIQDLATLDISKLTPLSPDVISRQATINVGTIGHVAHGKSTVVRSLTGVSTIRYKSEKERNITIKLGYANAKVYKTDEPDWQDDPTKCYASFGSTTPDEYEAEHPFFGGAPSDNKKVLWKMQRHISFVDCPGHDILMATMLNGAAVMDAALLLVAGNEPCPQPQTSEHLAAVEIMRLKNIIILQNKVELVQAEQSRTQHGDIKKFVEGTSAQNAPIIPISAVLKYNMDIVAQYLCTQIPIPPRDFMSDPEMIVIRSFDVNKPGEEIAKLKGGVAGGSIVKGVLKMGEEIEIRPGVLERREGGQGEAARTVCRPIRTRIVSLKSEQNDLQYAVPGGLIAVGTNVDPCLSKQDQLNGNVIGYPGKMPNVYESIEVKFYLLKRLLGVKTSGKDGKKEEAAKVKKLSAKEILQINIGSCNVGGRIEGFNDKKDACRIALINPVCTKEGDKVALSRRIEKHWRLIGWGEIQQGKQVKF